MTIKRILVVDDYQLTADSMEAFLNQRQGYRVIGTAYDGSAAVEKAWELKPDVVLLDYRMPPTDGADITRQILSRIRTNIIILSYHDNMLYVYHALEAGAKGYVLKGDTTDEVFRAIETVAQGERFITPKLADVFESDAVARMHLHQEKLKRLTARETEVLKLIAQGYTRAQIAEMLAIRPERFDQHRASILYKLGLNTNMDIVRFAVEAGLINLFPVHD